MLPLVPKYVPALVGALFLCSGTYKVVHPGDATMALVALDLNPGLAHISIIVVTTLELCLGAILLRRLDLRYALGTSVGLIFLLTVFLFYLSTMSNPPSCGCMGLTAVFRSNRSNAVLGLLRNCVLLWLLRGSHEYYFPAAALRNGTKYST